MRLAGFYSYSNDSGDAAAMPICWMTEERAWEFLARQPEGRLATCSAVGFPYITAVNHLVHEGKIYFHCKLTGQKLDNIRTNPRVCFETSCADKIAVAPARACGCSTRYTSVLAFGVARIVSDNQRKAALLNLLVRKFAAEKPFAPVLEDHVAGCAVVEIAIEEITGKMNIDPEQVEQ